MTNRQTSDLRVESSPGRLVLTQPFTSSASAATLWGELGPKWDQFDRWAASLDRIVSSDFDSGGSTVGAVRSCETGLGALSETVTRYDEEARSFSYRVVEGAPPGVDLMEASWRVDEAGDGASGEVSLTLALDDGAPAELPGMLREQLGGLLPAIAEELVHFVETGQPHPRKVAAAAAS